MGDSQPEKKRKKVVSTRTKAINANKTKAHDIGLMLINAGAISGFDDAAGLRRFLERANQLENNLVAMCDAKCAQVTSNVNKVAKTLRLQAEKHETLYADYRVE